MRIHPATLEIAPAAAGVSARLTVPGGKSPTNRALLLAAVARGRSRLAGLLDSADTDACAGALAALGVDIDHDPRRGTAAVTGNGGRFPTLSGTIPIGSAGTVGRFLPGLLAAAPEGDWVLSASPQLSARPLTPLLTALRQWGAAVEPASEAGAFPLRVRGGGLRGGALTVSAAESSQFASGVLLAAPLAATAATVSARDAAPDESYFDLTLDLMRAFGAVAEEVTASGDAPAGDRVFRVSPGGYRARDYAVAADANTANYFFALALILGGDIAVANLDPRAATPGIGFLDVLERMGATVERRAAEGGVRVSRTGALRGGFTLDLRSLSESAPTLAALAYFADAPVEMRNLAHIRRHESDRLAALAELLRSLGAGVEEYPDGLRIAPPDPSARRSAVLDPRDDHRLAMAMTLVALGARGATLENPGCVAKTCPDFFDRLRVLTPAAFPNADPRGAQP